MAAGRHLWFFCSRKWHHGTLPAVHGHQHTKFGENIWNSGWVMAIFLFPKWRRPPSWILLAVKSDVTARCGLSMPTIVPNLVTLTQMAAELLRFSVFRNGGRPPSWIWSNRHIGPPTMAHWRSWVYCQISYWSDLLFRRYWKFNFSYIWLEIA